MKRSAVLNEFLAGSGIWKRINAYASTARSRACAVAYVTDPSAIPFVSGDILVVDASDASIASGRTSAATLQEVHDRGVRIHSLPNLHAKVYVFDGVVVVASANLSEASQETLNEAGIVSRDPAVVDAARKHVAALAAMGTRVDRAFLTRILCIPVVRASDGKLPKASQPAREQAVPSQSGTWRLAEPPSGGAMLRAYFVALIQVQIGQLRANQPFRLWDGNFRTHLDAQRLIRRGDQFSLSESGVRYFTQGASAAKPALLSSFLSALRTGRLAELPVGLSNPKLVPLHSKQTT